MRKNLIIRNRIVSFALALFMFLGETVTVFAEPVSVNDVPNEQINEDEIDESDSVNVETDEDVNGECEFGEEASDGYESLNAESGVGLYNVSDVIGLKGYGSTESFKDYNWDKVLNYVYTYKYANPILKNTRYEPDSNGLYLVDGKYYSYVSNDCDLMCSIVHPFNEMVVLSGTKKDYYDSETDLYKVNGSYYINMVDLYDSNQQLMGTAYEIYNKVIPVGAYNKTVLQNCGRKADTKYPDNNYFDYYEVNGRYYKYIYASNHDVSYYVYETDEIDFTKVYASFDWNSLTIGDEPTVMDQKTVMVGYEIKINGEVSNRCKYTAIDSKGNLRRFTPYNYYTESSIAMSVNESVTIEVHPFYYYTDLVDEQNHIYENRMIAEAKNWTACTYTYIPQKEVQAVNGVKASYDNNKIKVSWNPCAEFGSVEIYHIDCKKQLNINYQNYYLYYTKMADEDATFLTENGLVRDDYDYGCEYTNNTFLEFSVEKDTEYVYRYYVVVPYSINSNYEDFQGISNVSCMASVAIPEKTGFNTPELKDFRVEHMANGKINATWTPVDAEVQIFYYDKPHYPDCFNFYSLKAMREEEYNSYIYKIKMESEISYHDRPEINKVKWVTCNGTQGSYDLQNILVPNKDYYILACTYDDTNYYTQKKDVPYVYTDKYGNTRSYQYYVQFSQPTAIVHAKKEFIKPRVNTTVAKDSVKLITEDFNATGIEIYRKVGKKYKKIATTTNDTYLDKNLKANTKYLYKVRYYFHDVDTKNSEYGPYTYVSVRTGIGANIDLKVSEKSRTSVKLNWNKVPSVSKYEIYRSDSENCNPKILSKSYSSGNYAVELRNQRFELIRTIKKAGTTSFTDKKLVPGEKYNYVIMAYYTNGKAIEYVTDSEEIELVLNKPDNFKSVNKGTSVKLTWDKDKYAAKYEIKYYYYDMYDQAQSKEPNFVTTKKNSYTIDGVSEGGYVKAWIRAQGIDNKYTDWAEISETTSLGVTSGIKAVNAKYTLSSGKQVDAVKITWKPVEGAKYYKVYRSTIEGEYNADSKRYCSKGVLIAKESNDNYYCNPDCCYSDCRVNNEVLYKEYNDVRGSVTGTTVYDCADLSVGVKYYYSVVAYGETYAAYHESKIYSKVYRLYVNFEATGKPGTVLYNAKPAIHKITNKKSGKAVLYWTGIKGSSKYYIYRSNKKGKGYKLIGTTKKQTYTDSKVKKGKTYYYKISAKGQNELKADMKTDLSAAKKIKIKK